MKKRTEQTETPRGTKTAYITELLKQGSLTAVQVAKLVGQKFGGEEEKNLRFVRAIPGHLKRRGIVAKYAKAGSENAGVVRVRIAA